MSPYKGPGEIAWVLGSIYHISNQGRYLGRRRGPERSYCIGSKERTLALVLADTWVRPGIPAQGSTTSPHLELPRRREKPRRAWTGTER